MAIKGTPTKHASEDRLDRITLIAMTIGFGKVLRERMIDGKWYQITSFNEDYQDNQIQMTAVEMANQQVNIVEPYNPSASQIAGGSSQPQEIGV